MNRSLVVIALLALVGCSSNDNSGGPQPSCPSCPAGTACNAATGQCVPTPAGGCVAGTVCGANATCNDQGACVCIPGWTDCNTDLAGGVGDGCECNQACNGTACGSVPVATCQPSVAHSCSSNASYCDGTACQSCPAGTFNCDGVATCESSQACQVPTSCQADVANSCGDGSSYCEAGSCMACPGGTSNCDGTGPCECSQGCDGTACDTGTPTFTCDSSCTQYLDFLCVKDAGGACKACDGSDDHCKANPRSNGNVCDNGFCTCNDDGDCTGRTTGRFCRQSGAIKMCACDSPADCQSPYTLCIGPDVSGKLAKQCKKPCQGDADCDLAGSVGTCDKATGLCSYPDDE